MFSRLRRTGALEAHRQQKAAEAHVLFRDPTANPPKLPNACPRDRWVREAEEQVRATLIEFPRDETS